MLLMVDSVIPAARNASLVGARTVTESEPPYKLLSPALLIAALKMDEVSPPI